MLISPTHEPAAKVEPSEAVPLTGNMRDPGRRRSGLRSRFSIQRPATPIGPPGSENIPSVSPDTKAKKHFLFDFFSYHSIVGYEVNRLLRHGTATAPDVHWLALTVARCEGEERSINAAAHKLENVEWRCFRIGSRIYRRAADGLSGCRVLYRVNSGEKPVSNHRVSVDHLSLKRAEISADVVDEVLSNVAGNTKYTTQGIDRLLVDMLSPQSSESREIIKPPCP